jgi:hypothetical protein
MFAKKFSVLASAAFLAFGAVGAHASLVGDTLEGSYYFPDTNTFYEDMGTSVITASGTQFTSEPLVVTVTGDTITANFTRADFWRPAAFNGFVLENLSKSFGTISLSSMTNMVGFTTANFVASGSLLTVNWQGLTFTPSTQVIFNVATLAAVPEPETYAMLLAGFGLVGAVARRRSKAVETTDLAAA